MMVVDNHRVESSSQGVNPGFVFGVRREISGIEPCSNSNSNIDLPRDVRPIDKGKSLNLVKAVDSVIMGRTDVIVSDIRTDLVGNLGLDSIDKSTLDGGIIKGVGATSNFNIGLPTGPSVVMNGGSRL